MIGMPRITLIRPALSPCRTRRRETRINAQSSPRMVDSNSEPTVTRIVSQTPCSRIGMNSVASRRKFCINTDHVLLFARSRLNHDRALLFRLGPISVDAEIASPRGCIRRLGLEPPFVENLVHRAISLELGERGVDLLQQILVGFADSDADGADH